MINILDYGYKIEFSDRIRDSENNVIGILFLDKEVKTYRYVLTKQYEMLTTYMKHKIERAMTDKVNSLVKKGYKKNEEINS